VANQTERHYFRRYPIQLPLLIEQDAPGPFGSKAGWTRNLSQGGACVELAEALPLRIALRVRLKREQGALEVEAKVAWIGQPQEENGGGVPHGLAFTRVPPSQDQDLSILLISAGLVRPAGLRVLCEVPVTYRPKPDAGPLLEGRTLDISRGGLLLRLPQLLPPWTALTLILDTPQGPLPAEGAITWVAPPERRTPGQPIRHGLRFTAITWTTLLSLARLLAELS
jgi:hypothetical protein